MNFFKLYIGDYQRDTGTLSLAEHGAYLLMLQHFYATEAPLPCGRDLHRLLRCETRAEREAVDSVASRFWERTEAGLVNARATQEFGRAAEISQTNRAIALARESKKRARTEHEPSTKRAPSVPRTEHEPSTNQIPDTRHQKKEEAAHRSATVSRAQPDAASPPPSAAPPAEPEPTGPSPAAVAFVAAVAAAPPGDPEARAARSVQIACLLRRDGVAVTGSHPQLAEWAAAGVTDVQIGEAMGIARLRKPAPQAVPVAYLATILEAEVLRPQPRAKADAWWTSDDAIACKARELEIPESRWPATYAELAAVVRQRQKEAAGGALQRG